MKIIVDAFGGDNSPLEILKGCALAVAEYNIDILLIGSKRELEKVIQENKIIMYHMEIKDVEDVIEMDEDPIQIMRAKSKSTMAEGLKALANAEGDAFVSAGNSGALVYGATMIVKRIKGIKRSAFAPILPKNKGNFMLIDSGANVECRPEMLRQFGVMGSAYMEKVMKTHSPRVGLVNVGVEDNKGGKFQRTVYNLLNNSPINFIGNIEARDIPFDGADVVVTDGFTGNIILKLYEGVATTIMKKIKKLFFRDVKARLASLLIKNDLLRIKKEMDYNEFGGAPILGISKPVFKIHGNAKAQAVKSAIGLTLDFVREDVIEKIYSKMQEIESSEKQDEGVEEV